MPDIYEYIKANISLDITDFTYIKVINERVEYYENKNNVIFLKDILNLENHDITLKVFLQETKSLVGLHGNTFTFISRGENVFPDFNKNIVNNKKEIFSVVEFEKGSTNAINYLSDNMKHHDLFIIDVTAYPILNCKNYLATFEKIEILDEFFKKPKLIRMYKHYSEFYIFF